MNYQELIDTMSPALYERLTRAVELGKWPDGTPLSREQRETTLRAIIAWGEQNLGERERVGFIDSKKKDGEVCDDPEEKPLNWQE